MSEEEKCLCTRVCDCQNPPPDDWDGKNGVYHVSMECPEHMEYPRPNPECPVHGHLSVLDFDLTQESDEGPTLNIGQLEFQF